MPAILRSWAKWYKRTPKETDYRPVALTAEITKDSNSSHVLKSRSHLYRPFVLRTEFLACLLIITLVLLAAVEYACMVIPRHNGFGKLSSRIMNETHQSWVSRIDIGGQAYGQFLMTTIINALLILQKAGKQDVEPKGRYDGDSASNNLHPSFHSELDNRVSHESLTLYVRQPMTGNVAVRLASSQKECRYQFTTTVWKTVISTVSGVLARQESSAIINLTTTPSRSVHSVSVHHIANATGNNSISAAFVPTTSASWLNDPRHSSINQAHSESAFSTSTDGIIIIEPVIFTMFDGTESAIATNPEPTVLVSDLLTQVTSPTTRETLTKPLLSPNTAQSTFTKSFGSTSLDIRPPDEKVSISMVQTIVTESITQLISYSTPETSTSTFPTSASQVVYTQFTTYVSSAVSQTSKTTSEPRVVVSFTTFTSLRKTTLYPASGTSTSLQPLSTFVNSSGVWVINSDKSTVAAPQITLRQYLTVSFLPLLITIFYSIPWRLIENTIRHLEPFYQLQALPKAPSMDPINLDYETPLIAVLPFKSFSQRHFSVFCSSSISVLMLFAAPLVSQVLYVSESDACGPDRLAPCATWAIYSDLARLVEALLGCIAFFVFIIMVLGFRRSTGVYSEPLSIVGLAALYQSSPLLRALHAIEQEMDKLRLQKQQLSSTDLGLLSYDPLPNDIRGSTMQNGPDSVGADAHMNTHNNDAISSTHDVSNTLWARLKFWVVSLWSHAKSRILYILTLLLLCGTLGLISYYYSTSKDTPFERFMDSQGPGVKFFMTAVGAGTNLLWSKIDSDLRKLEPYTRLLSPIPAKPQDSILVPTYMSPYTALLPSLHRKKYLVALISLCSILSEFLPITLANIPYSSTEMHIAWFVCTYVAMGILSLMIAGILLLIFFQVENELDGNPTTMERKLRYIAPGGEKDCEREGLLRRVEGLAGLGREERDARVVAGGRKYGLGVGEDGLVRVDEDERVVERWGGGKRSKRRSMGMGIGVGVGRGKTGNGGAGAGAV
ncbi:duf3433 domain protein [Rutstroemia sp. NJR-2017a WRK4]|nr:duf3433 domain protein [Rutstroemia sp. NJR-2017a WRK4]